VTIISDQAHLLEGQEKRDVRQPDVNQTGDASPREQSSAVCRAEELAAVLAEIHDISVDIHETRAGNALVSVYYGLLIYSNGESFRWTSPERGRSGRHLFTCATEPITAAERIAEHYKILRDLTIADVLRSGLPLLGDELSAEYVVPL
jgi:hypothetical protein